MPNNPDPPDPSVCAGGPTASGARADRRMYTIGASAARCGFSFPQRAALHPSEPRVEQMKAQVFAFPPARHRKIVGYVVAQMSKRRTVDAAEEFLADHLWTESTRLDDLGITDDEIERFCLDFARAAWVAFFKDRETRGIA